LATETEIGYSDHLPSRSQFYVGLQIKTLSTEYGVMNTVLSSPTGRFRSLFSSFIGGHRKLTRPQNRDCCPSSTIASKFRHPIAESKDDDEYYEGIRYPTLKFHTKARDKPGPANIMYSVINKDATRIHSLIVVMNLYAENDWDFTLITGQHRRILPSSQNNIANESHLRGEQRNSGQRHSLVIFVDGSMLMLSDCRRKPRCAGRYGRNCGCSCA
jgi:hypothetical protein